MDLNVVVRGQSNAFLMVSNDLNGVGARAMIDEAQRLLGFDGVNDRVLLDDWYTPDQMTVFGATAFIGDWVTRDPTGAWQPLELERSLLRNMAQNQPATETAIVWFHSEYDSLNPNLTAAEWVSAVRADAAFVRGALGVDASRSPYVFVSAIPFPTDHKASNQAIRVGMEALETDSAFGAIVGARALDVDMSYKFPFEYDYANYTYGGAHISAQDAVKIGERLGRSLAEEWAAYAKPGSPVAAAGGNIDDQGPWATEATVVGANQLLVRFSFDAASRLQALSPDAARGLGWSVRSESGEVAATSAALSGTDALLLTFEGVVPAGGKLFYGYGYGRLASGDGPGQGNAVYDEQGMPAWVGASGLAVTGGKGALDTGSVGLRRADVATQADGSVAVTHGGDAVLLRNVGEARFADGRLVFDADDPAAQVTRLYEAALDRLPEQGGLNAWIHAVQHGQPLSKIAAGFLGSTEFQSRFGAMHDSGAFVDQLPSWTSSMSTCSAASARRRGAHSGWASWTGARPAAPTSSSASPRARRTRPAPRRWFRVESGTAARRPPRSRASTTPCSAACPTRRDWSPGRGRSKAAPPPSRKSPTPSPAAPSSGASTAASATGTSPTRST